MKGCELMRWCGVAGLSLLLASCGGNLTVDLDDPTFGSGQNGNSGGFGGGGGGGGNENGSGGGNGNDNGSGNGNGNANENENGTGGGGNTNDNGGLEGCQTLICDNVCCAEGEQCIDGQCRLPDECPDTDFCGAGTSTPRCCPSSTPVCVFGQFCQAECPSPTNERCGANGEICCDDGFVCGESLTCVRDCPTDQALCGNGTTGSFGTTCCPTGDECIFDSCVTPGTECASFLDCENGEYCELVLDSDPANPDPNRGLCLPDDFPDDVPICQARPDDILLPQTEWRWLGMTIRNIGGLDAGEIVPECDGPSDQRCFVYPCEDYDDGGNCFNNVEAIPVVADLDRVPEPDGSSVPEVVIKAYRDDSFNSGNIVAVLDGESGQTLQVYYGDARGHMALANVDTDEELEIISLGAALRVYEPFPNPGTCTDYVTEDACDADLQCRWNGSACEAPACSTFTSSSACDADSQCRWTSGACTRRGARKWFTNDAAFNLDGGFSGGAPALTDFNADGRPEIVVGGAVIDALTGDGLVACPEDVGGSANTGEKWYISVVADTDLDGVPELVGGNRNYEITFDGSNWQCDQDWRADVPVDPGCSSLAGDRNACNARIACRWSNNGGDPDTCERIDLGAGFPGVGNFIDNHAWPYAPEPSSPCEGASEAECTGTCTWTGSVCELDVSAACAAIANEASCDSYIACEFGGGGCTEDSAQTALFPVDRNYPEIAVTDRGRVFVLHGATGEIMRSPRDGETPMQFPMFTRRGGTPNVADFDGDGRVEVSYASTGCMAVFDADCAVGSAERRRGEFAAWQAACGEPNIWQHPLCDTCDTTSDPVCNTCLNVDPSADACVAALPGCARTPLDSHDPDYLTNNDALACRNDIVPDVVRALDGVLWMRESQDASSAATGTSVFDFQGDGKAEVLYGDECFFRVYNGETGDLIFERPNSHRTATEYPIVVDVDGDQQSEILVGSNSDQATGRDDCGGSGNAYVTGTTRDGDPYERFTTAWCSCGNYDICDGLGQTACEETVGCAFDGSCAPVDCGAISDSVDCNATQACSYDSDATQCERSTLHPATQCDLGDGCFFDGASCEPFDCGAVSDQGTCDGNVACEWRGGSCVQSPRHPEYICENATWGLTVIGDTRDQWVRTLPYWHQHSYHVTEIDRQGNVVADWSPNPDNWDIYNNYRQNVQGFVPLNAPDLQIFSFAASLAQCPTSVRLAARVVNRGRAGILEGTPVVFYWLDGSTPEPIGTVGLPFSILPGQGADVALDVNLGSFGISPVSASFLVVANPPEGFEPVFECDGDNNSASVSGLSCIDGGG